MTRRTGPTAAVLAVVKERDGALCMRCQVAPSTETHHRIGRGMGGSRRPEVNSAPALVRLCHACHRWVSTHPREAEATGWVIRRSDARPPQEVELVDLVGAAFLLTEDGWVQPTIPAGFYPSDPALHVPAAFTQYLGEQTTRGVPDRNPDAIVCQPCWKAVEAEEDGG